VQFSYQTGICHGVLGLLLLALFGSVQLLVVADYLPGLLIQVVHVYVVIEGLSGRSELAEVCLLLEGADDLWDTQACQVVRSAFADIARARSLADGHLLDLRLFGSARSQRFWRGFLDAQDRRLDPFVLIQDRVINDISIITPGMINGDDTFLELRGMLLPYLVHVR